MEISILWAVLAIFGGLIALMIGGELLVRGASLLATAMKISPLVIGLTVVAFGTSAPELGVSLKASLTGAADVAVGNVVGSNIFNVLVIAGLSALVMPLIVSSQLIRIDVPLMIGASLAFWGFSLDGTIVRWEGVILFGSLIAYIVFCIRQSRKESREVVEEFAHEIPPPSAWTSNAFVQLGLMIGGLILLGVGSSWLVGGAVAIATLWGVSELIIGLTIVSVGTSLPEVVTSVVASYRGERDIAVGNVVGSNLFNLLCVVGLSSVVAPSGIPVTDAALAFDIPVMVAVAVVCLPIFFSGNLITRFEGGLFLAYYVFYTSLLILTETHPQMSRSFAWILGYVVIPLTATTLVGSMIWSWRVRNRKPPPAEEAA